MKVDISGLIDDWGKRCLVSRFSANVTASARSSGTFVNVASGVFWIQPVAGSSGRKEKGLEDRTTHMMFARLSSSFKAEDRISASGESYLYDVVSVDGENPTHLEIQLERIKRT